jgi:hypothetical protein
MVEKRKKDSQISLSEFNKQLELRTACFDEGDKVLFSTLIEAIVAGENETASQIYKEMSLGARAVVDWVKSVMPNIVSG